MRSVMLAAVMAAGLVPVVVQAQQAAAIDFSAVDAHIEYIIAQYNLPDAALVIIDR